MTNRFKRLAFLLFLVLGACRTQSSPGAPGGRLLLWYSWDSTETTALTQILDRFHEIYPDVTVISSVIPPNQLRDRFTETAELGLGPDLFIAPSDWVLDLAEAGLIQPIDDAELEEEKYLSTAVDTLRYKGRLYGLPLSLRPVSLYYNRNLVSEPAHTLDALLAQAPDLGVALNISFEQAFWGVPAFGGQLFDEDGRVVLEQGGFANWLSWLRNAQEVPGMILDRDREALRALFMDERVAYYVAGPEELPVLLAELGEETIGVTPLPAGPFGPAGPFLRVDAILFNSASSPRQKEAALLLAEFLTNAEQSSYLMRQLNRVPANQRVRIEPQAYAAIAGFAAQARTSVPILNVPQMEYLQVLGDDVYRQVLAGVLDPVEAAYAVSNETNEAFGSSPLVAQEQVCQSAGSLRLWHNWSGRAADALEMIASNFSRFCPETVIEIRGFSGDELYMQLAESQDDPLRPDLIIGSSERIADPVVNELLAPITNRVEATVLQRYIPIAQSALYYNDELYGLPVSLKLSALYYNRDLITGPPVTLDNLLLQAEAGNSVAIPIDFDNAFWGIRAFGAGLFDGSGRLPLEESGLVEWLTWLQMVQDMPNVILDDDESRLQELFTSGEVAYYVGPASALGDIEAALGSERVRVAALPAGPAGQAMPLMTVNAFLFNSAIEDSQLDLALAFAAYATTADSQALLMEEARYVPANANVDTTGFPAVTGFLVQAQTAVLWPSHPYAAAVDEVGDTLYREVLSDGAGDIISAACQFIRSVNEASDLSEEEDGLPAICLPGE